MKEVFYTVAENAPIAPGVYRLRLLGDTTAITAPGQFLELKLPGFFLRRPLSVCDWDEGSVTILYKVVGSGTDWLSRCAAGDVLSALSGLGNGFDPAACKDVTLVIGGGIGVPPMYGLAKRLIAQGKRVAAVIGFEHADNILLADDFRALGASVILTTADGSVGIRGFVTNGMAEAGEYTYLYTCGPDPMLRAVYDACRTSGQFSFEERMGCGFGACMGCTCRTKYGNKRICKDGPVLQKEEIVW